MVLPVRAPSEVEDSSCNADLLRANELEELCHRDEEVIRDELARSLPKNETMKFALLGDWPQISRLVVRDELTAKDVSAPPLVYKGSIAKNSSCTAWCLWERKFRRLGVIEFHICRTQVDTRCGRKAGYSDEKISQDATSALVAVLRVAQKEAGSSGCPSVIMHNPSARLLRAVNHIDPSVRLVSRDTVAIPFIHWYRNEDRLRSLEWIDNEFHCNF